MALPLVALGPIVTAVGRFAVPYLAKELGKIGNNKFIQTYGKDAFTSLNETLAADTPMVKADNVPMVNPNFASTDSDDDDPNLPMVKDQNKSNQPQQEPPKDKGPNIGTEVATEAALEISKNLSKEEDIKSQTQKALEPKVEFGPLTETEKQTAQALMGNQPEFYSRVVKSIKDAKPNKLTKNKWKSFIQGDKQELKFLGLDKFLQGNESITKQELLDFVDQTNFANKLKVVEVPLEDQYDFSQFSIGGAGGKRAVSGLPDNDVLNEKAREGYKSTVEQYVFQVDNISFDEEGKVKELNVGDADTAHFPLKYAKNAIAHARAQTGYFDADAVEKRLNKKEAAGGELTKYDKTLKNASRQLEDTFIIDEIQSDVIQRLQKEGIFEDHIVIDNRDIVDYLNKNNIEYKILPQEEYGKKSGLPINEKYESYIEFKPTGYATRRTIPIVKERNNRFEIFTKDGEHGESIFGNVNSLDEAIKYFKKSGTYGVPGLPITESKKYVELVLNAMIKKAVEKDLDSIGITNGQIQYDRYAAQPIKDKEGLRKFYDEIVYKQLEKIAKKYNVELETVELPGKSEVKGFDDVGLDEPTEESDSRYIQRRIGRAADEGFVLRKVKYGTLASTIENLNRGNIDGDPLPDDPNVVLPDYASIFTEAGRGAGDRILDTLIDDNPDIENEKDYYIWVKPDSKIDKAIARANAGELMSLASAWDIRDINLQMPISSVIEIPQSIQGTGADYLDYFSTVADGTSNQAENLAEYSFYIKNYFSNKEKIDLQYPHEIIKMKLPKKLQKDILSKPIKLSKAKQQTDRLFA